MNLHCVKKVLVQYSEGYKVNSTIFNGAILIKRHQQFIVLHFLLKFFSFSLSFYKQSLFGVYWTLLLYSHKKL